MIPIEFLNLSKPQHGTSWPLHQSTNSANSFGQYRTFSLTVGNKNFHDDHSNPPENKRVKTSQSAPLPSKIFPDHQPRNWVREKHSKRSNFSFLVSQRWDYFVVLKSEEIENKKITQENHPT